MGITQRQSLRVLCGAEFLFCCELLPQSFKKCEPFTAAFQCSGTPDSDQLEIRRISAVGQASFLQVVCRDRRVVCSQEEHGPLNGYALLSIGPVLPVIYVELIIADSFLLLLAYLLIPVNIS